jgi:hypothetical protein
VLAPHLPSGVELVGVEGVNVTVRVPPMPAGARGTLLMDLEDRLRHKVSPALVVWHEAMGDRSSLRNLRGIEIKR